MRQTLMILMFLFPGAVLAGGSASGSVTGKVVFTGFNPGKGADVPTLDKHACGSEPIPDKGKMIGENGEMGFAVVTLKPTHGTLASRLDKTVKVDQRGIEFLPFTVVAPPDGTLEVSNNDKAFHNVHLKQGGTILNIAQPMGSATLKRSIASWKKTGPIRMECDLHYWMKGWVFVTSDPIATVTDATGAFAFENLPPGDYTATIWHSLLLEARTQSVTIQEGKNELTLTVSDL